MRGARRASPEPDVRGPRHGGPRPPRPPHHAPRGGGDAGVHAGRHARRRQGGHPPGAGGGGGLGDARQPLSPRPAAGDRHGREARRDPRLHRLAGADPHRQRRLPGLQPGRPAHRRRRGRDLPQPPRRLPPALHPRDRGRATSSGWASTSPWCSTSAPPGRWSPRRRRPPGSARSPGRAPRGRPGGTTGGAGGLFGIVQGSCFPDLRARAAADLAALDFAGYAIGGVSVGEPEAERRAVVEWTAPALPAAKPRYLMGVGYPADILHAVRQGVDLFDCVLPARNARHGVLFTRQGVIKIKNARYRDDERPLDPECGCPACARISRAFLHHLTRAGELTAPVLATLHNLRFYLDFMADLRQAIQLGTLTDLASLACRTAGEDAPEGPDVRARPDSIRPPRSEELLKATVPGPTRCTHESKYHPLLGLGAPAPLRQRDHGRAHRARPDAPHLRHLLRRAHAPDAAAAQGAAAS